MLTYQIIVGLHWLDNSSHNMRLFRWFSHLIMPGVAIDLLRKLNRDQNTSSTIIVYTIYKIFTHLECHWLFTLLWQHERPLSSSRPHCPLAPPHLIRAQPCPFLYIVQPRSCWPSSWTVPAVLPCNMVFDRVLNPIHRREQPSSSGITPAVFLLQGRMQYTYVCSKTDPFVLSCCFVYNFFLPDYVRSSRLKESREQVLVPLRIQCELTLNKLILPNTIC